MFIGSTPRRTAVLAGVVLTTVFAAGVIPGTAWADTASTRVGQLTASWNGLCNDLGVDVAVSVSSGIGNASYTAVSARGFPTPAAFVTDAAGHGVGVIHNAWPDQGFTGTITVRATAAGQVGQVTVAVDCPDPKGG